MSKIGKTPVDLVENVKASIDGQKFTVTGPKGTLERVFPKFVKIDITEKLIEINVKSKTKSAQSMFGTARAIIANMVKGVNEGWSKQLELVGTGYRAETTGKKLTLTVGFSHPVVIEAPEGISFVVEKTNITVEGIDKEVVGHIAAIIRDVRPPEPYKGKGIRYKEEYVRRKPGKAAKAQGAA